MKYFVIGSGIWGCVLAERISSQLNAEVVVIEKRNHVGGNCFSSFDEETGIECHRYGSHIFHTDLPHVAEYINRFCKLTAYRHRVLTRHKNHVYTMPINLSTINSFYGLDMSPEECERFLREEIATHKIINPENLEEKAISLIGKPLYEAFIKNYTYKQWNRAPHELPAEIITRLPFRTNYNSEYFSDQFQGVPEDGYEKLFEKLLSNPLITVNLCTDYKHIKDKLPAEAFIIYSGLPDELFDYKFGALDWRSLRFEWETVPVRDFQGTSVMNYADLEFPFTRIHEFKHFHPERQIPYNKEMTIICKEFSQDFEPGKEAYYPINDRKNMELYARYSIEAEQTPNLVLGGRLGSYKYWDMDKAIANALEYFDKKIKPSVS